MTVMEALQWANEKLKKHADVVEHGGRVDSPMLDAEVLLSSAVGEPKSWLFTHFADSIRPHQEERFRSYIERRARHEPVAYMIGSKEFYKRKFYVNRFVLIPRPSTETLVAAALAIAKESDPETTVFADIGTGSGAIAVTLSAESGLPVIATDTNKRALAVAKKNAAEHGVEERIDFRAGDLLEPLARIFETLKAQQVRSPIRHLIICANLPYLTEHQWAAAQAEVRDYEPKLALVSGADGLDAYWNFFRQFLRGRRLLPQRVSALIEIDPSQRERIITLIRHDFPHAEPDILKDLDGFDRVVVTEF